MQVVAARLRKRVILIEASRFHARCLQRSCLTALQAFVHYQRRVCVWISFRILEASCSTVELCRQVQLYVIRTRQNSSVYCKKAALLAWKSAWLREIDREVMLLGRLRVFFMEKTRKVVFRLRRYAFQKQSRRNQLQHALGFRRRSLINGSFQGWSRKVSQRARVTRACSQMQSMRRFMVMKACFESLVKYCGEAVQRRSLLSFAQEVLSRFVYTPNIFC